VESPTISYRSVWHSGEIHTIVPSALSWSLACVIGLRTKQIAPGCCFLSTSLLQLWGRTESQRLWTGDKTQSVSMAKDDSSTTAHTVTICYDYAPRAKATSWVKIFHDRKVVTVAIRANPYDFIADVRDRNLFAGRRSEIALIREELARLAAMTSAAPVVALIGERRVGKTRACWRIHNLSYVSSRISITEETKLDVCTFTAYW